MKPTHNKLYDKLHNKLYDKPHNKLYKRRGKHMTLVGITKPEFRVKLHYDQDLVRSALIAELDATSLYQSHLEHLNDEGAKRLFEHIMNEEKEHVSELQCLLMKLDKTQEEKMTEVNASTCIAGGFQS